MAAGIGAFARGRRSYARLRPVHRPVFSIGIYRGASPLRLAPATSDDRPV